MRRTKQIRHTADLPRPPKARTSPIVPVLAFAGITVAVMQTLLVPVIKDLPALLGTAPSQRHLGDDLDPARGRRGDPDHGPARRPLRQAPHAARQPRRHGGRLADLRVHRDLVVMIVGRALQGFAMGAIPLGIGIMRDELPREKLGSAMALMSSSIGVGGGLALPAAALVAQHTDWHALFFGAAGLGVLAIGAHRRRSYRSPAARPGHLRLPRRLGLSARPGPPAPADHQGQRLGLGLGHHPRPVRRVRHGPGAVGPVGTARPGARWSTCAPPPAARCCSPTSPRSWSASPSTRLPGPAAAAPAARRPPATASGSRWSSRDCAWRRWA